MLWKGGKTSWLTTGHWLSKQVYWRELETAAPPPGPASDDIARTIWQHVYPWFFFFFFLHHFGAEWGSGDASSIECDVILWSWHHHSTTPLHGKCCLLLNIQYLKLHVPQKINANSDEAGVDGANMSSEWTGQTYCTVSNPAMLISLTIAPNLYLAFLFSNFLLNNIANKTWQVYRTEGRKWGEAPGDIVADSG